MRPLLVSLALIVSVPVAHAQSTQFPVTTEELPDGIFTFTLDAWGGMGGGANGVTYINARDPAAKATFQGDVLVINESALNIVWRDPDPAEPDLSEHVSLGEAITGANTWRATDVIRPFPALYNPAEDTWDAGTKTRTSRFGLASSGTLSAIRVELVQQVVGQSVVQTYVFTNASGAAIEILTIPASDTDIEHNGGYGSNWSSHDPKWLGGGSASMTTLDNLREVGHTISVEVLALGGSVYEGWKGMRAGAVGWEVTRAGALFGYPLDNLNHFFRRPFNGAYLPFAEDVIDDTVQPGVSPDGPGDVAMSFQHRVTIPANGSATLRVTHTLFANGPWIIECPSADLAPGESIDALVQHYTGYGNRTLTQSGLPAGFSLAAGDRVQGVATTPGTFDYTLTTTDELGRFDSIDCQIRVAAPCYEGDESCTVDVVYTVLVDAGGVPRKTARCEHASNGTVTCDTEADGVTLKAYDALWCPYTGVGE